MYVRASAGTNTDPLLHPQRKLPQIIDDRIWARLKPSLRKPILSNIRFRETCQAYIDHHDIYVKVQALHDALLAKGTSLVAAVPSLVEFAMLDSVKQLCENYDIVPAILWDSSDSDDVLDAVRNDLVSYHEDKSRELLGIFFGRHRGKFKNVEDLLSPTAYLTCSECEKPIPCDIAIQHECLSMVNFPASAHLPSFSNIQAYFMAQGYLTVQFRKARDPAILRRCDRSVKAAQTLLNLLAKDTAKKAPETHQEARDLGSIFQCTNRACGLTYEYIAQQAHIKISKTSMTFHEAVTHAVRPRGRKDLTDEIGEVKREADYHTTFTIT